VSITDFVLARIAEKAKEADLDENIGHISGRGYAQAMAECAAMRKIVELHAVTVERVWENSWDGPAKQVDERSCAICGWVPDACDTIRALASAWSDHPDWREEWV
jgi:hypothetical protein